MGRGDPEAVFVRSDKIKPALDKIIGEFYVVIFCKTLCNNHHTMAWKDYSGTDGT